MRFFLDTMRGWLSPTVEGRLAGRAALAARMLHSEPVRASHPELELPEDVGIWHFPKRGFPFAATMTLGLAETQGRELVAFTLGDSRDPSREPLTRVLQAAIEAQVGEVRPLPEGTLGRSAHRHVCVAGAPDLLDPERRPDWEGVLGGALVMVLVITDAERDFVLEHGHQALLDRMRDQEIGPYCDRRAGDLEL